MAVVSEVEEQIQEKDDDDEEQLKERLLSARFLWANYYSSVPLFMGFMCVCNVYLGI